MNVKDAIVKAMQEYRQITGLRSYLIQDVDDINSAAERNYFCKCLKTSARALKHCEECTMENYRSAVSYTHLICSIRHSLIGSSAVHRQQKTNT